MPLDNEEMIKSGVWNMVNSPNGCFSLGEFLIDLGLIMRIYQEDKIQNYGTVWLIRP